MKGNVLFAREMAKRHGDKIVSIALNPGNIKSELQRHMTAMQERMIVRFAPSLLVYLRTQSSLRTYSCSRLLMVPSPNYGLVRSLRPKAAMERFVAYTPFSIDGALISIFSSSFRGLVLVLCRLWQRMLRLGRSFGDGSKSSAVVSNGSHSLR